MSLFAKKNDNSGDETRHFVGISSDTDFIAPHEKSVEQGEINFTLGAPERCVDVAAAEEKPAFDELDGGKEKDFESMVNEYLDHPVRAEKTSPSENVPSTAIDKWLFGENDEKKNEEDVKEEMQMSEVSRMTRANPNGRIVRRYHFWYYDDKGEKQYSDKEYESAARQASQDGHVVEKYHWLNTGKELTSEEVAQFLP